MKYIVFILTVFVLIFNPFEEGAPEERGCNVNGRIESNISLSLPLYFFKNEGTHPKSTIFYIEGERSIISFQKAGLNYKNDNINFGLKFLDCNKTTPVSLKKDKANVNYLVGNTPSHWYRTHAYKEIVYKEIYPFIDIHFTGRTNELKYTCKLLPGANIDEIKFQYSNVDNILIDKNTGNLIIETPNGDIRDLQPKAFQLVNNSHIEVDISFLLLEKNTVGFECKNYMSEYELIIDPGFSTYVGTGFPYAIDVDSDGNIYVAGGDDNDTRAFVKKISNDGKSLIYATYIGDRSSVFDIKVDSSGNVYITGGTASADFPLVNPYQSTRQGTKDAFVAKLSEDGSNFIYSTYIGGSFGEEGIGIDVDSSGSAYITGWTSSPDFPTKNAFDGSAGFRGDHAFVTKFSSNGKSIIYSTYLRGSSGMVRGEDIVVDDDGFAYIVGITMASNFPTLNAFQGVYAGGWDAFVTKLSNTGQSLVFSTYLGGESVDWGYGIALDNAKNVYVIGYTSSTNFPTKNPYQTDLHGSNDAFITKFNSDGDSIKYSTYFGGSQSEQGRGIAIDRENNVVITGVTSSDDFPIINSYQYENAGNDAYVSRFSSNDFDLLFSTYIGGSNNDMGWAVATDKNNNIYITGQTYSSDFPTSPDAYEKKQDRGGFLASFLVDATSAVKLIDENIPDNFLLLENYPNPFNPTTTISFEIRETNQVNLVVINLLGDEVRHLVNEVKEFGKYSVTWDGKNDERMDVVSGVYICKITSGKYSAVQKMTLIR
jgi:hypothetical protein